MIQLFNEDCMDVMSRYPDGYFDLLIADPPYGGGHATRNAKTTLPLRFGGRFDRYRQTETPPDLADGLADTNTPNSKKKNTRHKRKILKIRQGGLSDRRNLDVEIWRGY